MTCAPAPPWVNQVNGVSVLHQVADDESLHPTVAGYAAMAKVLASRLDAGHFSSGATEQDILNAYKADSGPGGLVRPADYPADTLTTIPPASLRIVSRPRRASG
jgi:hypothetical protein